MIVRIGLQITGWLLLAMLAFGDAHGQQVNLYCNTGPAGQTAWQPASNANPCPVSASVSASISGFTAATTGTPIAVTTGGVTGALPAGAVVVVTNVGTTNGAYCQLGNSATTSSQYISPGGGWFAFTVGASTNLTCITSTSTTTVNLTGGAGLPTGTGGGSGSGGSGSNASVGSTGAAVPGSATYVGINSGGNLTGWNGAVTNAGTFAVQAAQSGNWPVRLQDGSGNSITSTTGAIDVNVANTNANGQAAMAASSPVVFASDQKAADPCMFQAKTTVPISTSSGGPVSLVALSGSTKVYICSISAITDTAIKLSFIDGTGGSCASAQHAIWGSTTAASGMSLAANGGFTMGNGQGTVGVTAAASDFCLLQSGTSLVAGNLTYVQQ